MAKASTHACESQQHFSLIVFDPPVTTGGRAERPIMILAFDQLSLVDFLARTDRRETLMQ